MKAENERLNPIQRLLELLIIVVMLSLMGFFAYHQWLDTGFFTEEFRTIEMLCLYVPITVAVIAPAIRAITGHRNPARPFEVATNVSLAVGSLWLFIVFPLNYAHLADILPEEMRFLLSWVTDGLARFVLLLQVILGPISSVPILWKYLSMADDDRPYERIRDIVEA